MSTVSGRRNANSPCGGVSESLLVCDSLRRNSAGGDAQKAEFTLRMFMGTVESPSLKHLLAGQLTRFSC